jgi:lipid-A-disaccharide synthase
LLPGSRLSEIDTLGRDFIDAARRLSAQFPGLRVIAPMANGACRSAFERILASRLRPDETSAQILIIDQASAGARADTRFSVSQLAMIAADAVLLASGTAALEAMLAKRPMVVAYRVAPLTYWLVTRLRLLRTQVYSLPNILAGRALVPELMQEDCAPEALAAALVPPLQARSLDAATHEEFLRLHAALRGDPASSAGMAIAEIISAG